MNKFHLINPIGKESVDQIKKMEEFVRSSNKVLFFTDINVISHLNPLELY